MKDIIFGDTEQQHAHIGRKTAKQLLQELHRRERVRRTRVVMPGEDMLQKEECYTAQLRRVITQRLRTRNASGHAESTGNRAYDVAIAILGIFDEDVMRSLARMESALRVMEGQFVLVAYEVPLLGRCRGVMHVKRLGLIEGTALVVQKNREPHCILPTSAYLDLHTADARKVRRHVLAWDGAYRVPPITEFVLVHTQGKAMVRHMEPTLTHIAPTLYMGNSVVEWVLRHRNRSLSQYRAMLQSDRKEREPVYG